MSESIHIGIFGLGAIGSVIASTLKSKADQRIFYFNRSNINNIRVVGPSTIWNKEIHLSDSKKENISLDWLIICLKEHQFIDAQETLNRIINENTKVVIIRNGLRHQESLCGHFEPSNILPAIIDCSTAEIDRSIYKYKSKPQIVIPNISLAQSFISLFNPKVISVKLSDDFLTESWKKLCLSASLGAVLSYYNQTCSIFKTKKHLDLILNLLQEARLVALADGAHISEEYVEQTMGQIIGYPPDKGSSMLTDFRMGRRLELGAKSGIICKLGSFYGVPTPLHLKMINQLIKNTYLKYF